MVEPGWPKFETYAREKISGKKRRYIFGHKVILRLFSSCLDSCSFILSTKSDRERAMNFTAR